MPDSVFSDKLHLSKACWELWLSDDQPHSDYNGQWQRALCMMAVQTHKGIKKYKMFPIKQIKICAEYRDMLPRPRLDLSGTPGLRPIGLSPGSWQTSLGLSSMSRYSAQILICITYVRCKVIPCVRKAGAWHNKIHTSHGHIFTEIRCIINVKMSSTAFSEIGKFIVNMFHCGIFFGGFKSQILVISGSLTTDILKQQFTSLRGTTWRNNGSSIRNGYCFEHHIHP